jgi:hypothetical protein
MLRLDLRVRRPGTSLAYRAGGVEAIGVRTQRSRSPAVALAVALLLPRAAHAAPGDDRALGYGGSPPSVRSTAALSRRDAATVIARLAGYDTRPPQASTFADVSPGDAQLGAIEAMWREGVTGGCRRTGERRAGRSPSRARHFCPDRPATRGQLAMFLARAFAIAPPTGGQHFSDVPSAHPYYPFVEGLAQAGLAEPCPGQPGKFCPDAPVSRGDGAAMLSRLLLAGAEPAPTRQSVLPWTSRRNASSLVLSGRPLRRSSSSRDSPPTFWR